MLDGWNPLAERFDASAGLWLSEHARKDGSRFVIGRPYRDGIGWMAAGDTAAAAISNWRDRREADFLAFVGKAAA